MPIYDYECNKCRLIHENITNSDTKIIKCPNCDNDSYKIVSMPKILTNIVPAYPGCKKKKAGYQHTHADRKATKVQSGYGGCSSV